MSHALYMILYYIKIGFVLLIQIASTVFFFLDGFSTIYPIILIVKYFYFHNPPLMASGKLCYVPWSFLTAAHKVYNCLLIIIKVLKVLYVVTKKWRHKRTTNVMNINVHFKCTVKTPVLFFSICLINTQ